MWVLHSSLQSTALSLQGISQLKIVISRSGWWSRFVRNMPTHFSAFKPILHLENQFSRFSRWPLSDVWWSAMGRLILCKQWCRLHRGWVLYFVSFLEGHVWMFWTAAAMMWSLWDPCYGRPEGRLVDFSHGWKLEVNLWKTTALSWFRDHHNVCCLTRSGSASGVDRRL